MASESISVNRNAIIKSHIEFGKFLDTDIINKLVHLFSKETPKHANSNYKISKFIEDERNIRGLDNSNIKIVSEVYGETDNNSTLFLSIKKNNIEILHLTIHLIVRSLNSDGSGIIHISKNIYTNKKLPRRLRIKPYALISVKKPIGKPRSLEFSIEDSYNTAGVPNAEIYDPIIQQEMDVIITVLNRIFDEDNKEFYIGNPNTFAQIHNTTNTVLANINSTRTHVTRKNVGTRLMPLNNSPAISIGPKVHKTKSKSTRNTRKKE